MKPRLNFLTLSLLSVIVLLACAPVAAPVPTPTRPSAAETPIPPILVPTDAPTQTPQAVATSRGPNLEATDPTAVSLNAGQLQLVEFFRFT